MVNKANRKRGIAAFVLVLNLAAVTGIYAFLHGADESAAAAKAERIHSAPTRPGVAPSQPESSAFPKQIFDQPFVDGRPVGEVVDAQRELSFAAVAPASLGHPTQILLHRDYRPQALALVYDHPSPPDVNGVVWIHHGGTRFQLFGPATTLSVPEVLTLANVIEVAA